MIDPHTPVIVGAGQITRHPDDFPDLEHALEPVDLMVEAARRAEEDAGATRSLLTRLDATFVPQPLTRRYPDPARLVNERLDRPTARGFRALVGGNSPQLLVNEVSAAIQRGDMDVALITGAEAMSSRVRARRAGIDLDWERSDVPPCPNEIGDARPGTSPYENDHGASIPIHVYPLFETALRHRRGSSVDDHQAAIGSLWSRFSTVASQNPHAWTRETFSPEEIAQPSASNRVVTFPYTKRMCANLTVDQGAALLVTSLEAARAAGVPDAHLVFPLSGADAHDHFWFTERWALGESPAIRATVRDALAAANCHLDDVAHVDLYSCFPSAVEIAADAVGLVAGDERVPTLTGGLALFGGPGNNYVTHSIAAAVARCRAEPASAALVTGVGWYLTKHSAGLYSTSPPRDGFRRVDPATTQASVDALPRREAAGAYDGDASIEATAVVHDRDGQPQEAIVSSLTNDGRRVLATVEDPSTVSGMCEEPWEGRSVKIAAGSSTNTVVA